MNKIKLSEIYLELLDNGLNNRVARILSLVICSIENNIKIKDNKATCLLISGVSGTGKTRVVDLISKIINLKTISVDIKRYSETGYVGDNIHEIFENFNSYSIDSKIKAIVHIDEFDKIKDQLKTNNARDISGLGIQESLLKPIDGVDFHLDNKSRAVKPKGDKLSTRDLIFIFTGSFEGKKINDSSNLINTGFIPELANRIDFFLPLELPDIKYLSKIINRGTILNESITLCSNFGVKVDFEDNFKEKLLEISVDKRYCYREIKNRVLDITIEKLSNYFIQNNNNELVIKGSDL